jgi:peptidyl-prolyl cis-trans isomerase C
MHFSLPKVLGLTWVIGSLLLTGCRAGVVTGETPQPTAVVEQPTPAVTLTPTTVPTPTFTPEPLAALVNGEGISLAEFQAELERYRKALAEVSAASPGTILATEEVTEEMLALNYLIEETLLAQAAAQAGYVLDTGLVQQRYADLAASVDTDAWLQANFYTDESFMSALSRSIQSAWMRDQILAEMPAFPEQVHARQILLYNSTEASLVLANLQSGADFENLARQYDPVDAGDLGWFPRGYLTEPAIEEAAFGLQPGEFSNVIETPLGFHLVQVVERSSEQPLAPEAKLAVQELTLQQWLEERKAGSDIQVLIP